MSLSQRHSVQPPLMARIMEFQRPFTHISSQQSGWQIFLILN